MYSDTIKKPTNTHQDTPQKTDHSENKIHQTLSKITVPTCVAEMPLPLVVIETNGTVMYFNKPFLKFFDGENIKNIFDDFFLKRDKKRLQKTLKELAPMESEIDTEHFSKTIYTILQKERCIIPLKDNGVNIISLTIDVNKPARDIRKVVGLNRFVIVFRELGNLNMMEIEKLQHQEISQKNAFSSILVHEIRTPLNAIINISQYFLGTKNENKQEREELLEGLDTIFHYGKRLNLFLNDLSEFVMLESGNKKMEEAFRIRDIAPKLDLFFSSVIHEKDLKMQIDYSEIDGEILIGDRLRLYQTLIILLLFFTKTYSEGRLEIFFRRTFSDKVLENVLLIEAKIHSKDSGVKNDFYLEILKRNVKKMQGSEKVKIKNETITIDLIIPLLLQKLSDYTEDSYTNSKSGSANGAIGANGTNGTTGTTGTDSTTGTNGTKSSAATSTTTTVSEKKDDRGTKDGEAHPKKVEKKAAILAIDDEPLSLKALNILLDEQDIDLYTATSGEGGLEKIKQHHREVKLILMDMFLPDIDGYKLFDKIKKAYPKIPIVAFSALNEKGEIDKMLNAGFFDYLPKPFEKEELLELLKLVD